MECWLPDFEYARSRCLCNMSSLKEGGPVSNMVTLAYNKPVVSTNEGVVAKGISESNFNYVVIKNGPTILHML